MHSVKIVYTFLLIFSFTITLVLYFNLSSCSFENKSIHSVSNDNLSGKPDYFLVVIILSSPTNKNRRTILRNTWLQLSNGQNIKYYFVVGTKSLNQVMKEEINNESVYFQDIITIDHVSDSYNELTTKVLEAFIWIIQNIKFKYVLKCDDDSFVHILELIKLLESYEGNQKQLYLGFFSGHATVQKSGKWKENNWMLCDYYIPYALGGGYILQHELVNFIARNSEDLEMFISEDVSVGTWLASKKNVNRVHSYRFNTEYKSRGCSNSYIVSHKHTDSQLQKLYNNLKKSGKMCIEEFQVRLSYNYNWTVPPSKCCQRINQIP